MEWPEEGTAIETSEMTGPAPALTPPPGECGIMCDQMRSMKADMESLREIVLGLASSQAAGCATPAAAGSLTLAMTGSDSATPAAAGSAVMVDRPTIRVIG